ncbi:MAG TPA: hypothetical protein DCE41_33895 [Cytophagales bacterium]|nr:hypothetical protein [Cytophagales bacterium]HAA17988.1 hypothetical protein [Cytophagales bacterium]HAP64733.1 hypothetical protein [Cytophagales bacterium]
MHRFILLFVMVSTVGVCQAQMAQELTEEPISKEAKHAVGLSAGITTGVGISYRYWPKKLGIQLTAAPIFTSESTFASGGATFLLKLKENDWSNFFGYWGNHFLFTQDQNFDFYGNPYLYRTSDYYLGLGGGLEFLLDENLSFSFMAGFAGVNLLTTPGFSLTAEASFFYRF